MIRYCISAQDVESNTSRWPLFRDPAGSAEYLGTIVHPTNVTSKLPIFHLFISPANQLAADSQTGSRASFFHDNEFLRQHRHRGARQHLGEFHQKIPPAGVQQGASVAAPRSRGRLRKTSLMAEFGDPSYLRQHLSFWLQNLAGVPAAF